LDARKKGARLWLAVAYLAAAFGVNCAHDHHTAHTDVPAAQPGCDDPNPHFAAHTDAPDLSGPTEPCPACQHRGQPQNVEVSRPTLLPHVVGVRHAKSDRIHFAYSVGRISCRAPPRV
jgi:hypothetical protein